MKMKKLLASALAATMILSSMVSSFVASAAAAGTITAGSVNKVVGNTDTVAVDVVIDLGEGVVAPHNIVKVSLDGYNLTDVTLGEVVYAEGSAAGVVTIDEKNLADGKVLIEAPVDNKAPTVKKITFTATFTDADENDTAEGTYDIVVNAEDMTNVSEAALELTAVKGALVVAHECVAGEEVTEKEVAATCTTDGSYDTVTYCVTCNKELSRVTNTVKATGHAYDDGVIDPDATCDSDGVKTFTCANCGDAYTEAVSAKGHSFADGTCTVCGAADPDYIPPVVEVPVNESISCTFSGGLGVTAYVSLRFKISELKTKAEGKAYASYELAITREVMGDNYSIVEEEIVLNNPTISSGYAIYYLRGYELYAANLNVSAELIGKDANGKVIEKSDVFGSSLRDALYALVIKSTNAKQKAAITDFIVAAAEVQQFFANSNKNSDLAKRDLPTKDFPLDAATKEVGELATYNTPDNGAIAIGVGGGVTAAPYLTFNMPVPQADAASYNLHLSYYDAVSKAKVEKTVNLASSNTDEVRYSGGKYYIYFRDMTLSASNAEVTATLYKDGQAEKISSYSYCLDVYYSSRLTNSMFVALAKLGQSFRALSGV